MTFIISFTNIEIEDNFGRLICNIKVRHSSRLLMFMLSIPAQLRHLRKEKRKILEKFERKLNNITLYVKYIFGKLSQNKGLRIADTFFFRNREAFLHERLNDS